MFAVGDFFDLTRTAHAELFRGTVRVWEVLTRIEDYCRKHAGQGQQHETRGRVHIDGNVTIGGGTMVEEGAMILGPSIIGADCRIRHNAYIRPCSIIGDGCVVGNSSEVKNALLFNEARVPHFNYAGDSVLGHRAHLGAGAKISNLKLTTGTILVDAVDEYGNPVDSGLRKFGAIVGDHCEVGCNAVLNPGSLLEPCSIVYPNLCFRGILPRHNIAKNRSPIEVVMGRPRDGWPPNACPDPQGP